MARTPDITFGTVKHWNMGGAVVPHDPATIRILHTKIISTGLRFSSLQNVFEAGGNGIVVPASFELYLWAYKLKSIVDNNTPQLKWSIGHGSDDVGNNTLTAPADFKSIINNEMMGTVLRYNATDDQRQGPLGLTIPTGRVPYLVAQSGADVHEPAITVLAELIPT